MPLKRWNKLSQKTVIKNKYWSYELDEFEIENGFKGEYHYVHTAGSTMIIPVSADGNIFLVNQYRYLNKKESLEFPCGMIADKLSPIENALKELREETGYASKNIQSIGFFSPYTGASDEICSVFVAYELYKDELKADDTEEFEIARLSPLEIDKRIENNSIWDGMTLAAWMLARKLFYK